MARWLVIITSSLWLLIALIGRPEFALLPLYGLYPGAISSGEPGYSQTAIHAWAIFVATVFCVLAGLALWRKSVAAGVAFVALFLVSALVLVARLVNVLTDLH